MLTKSVNSIATVQEMQSFAANVAAHVPSGSILLLYGELGAGKTTFVQGLAKAVGIPDDITSPTFTIVAEHSVLNHPIFKVLVHVDLYRFEGDQAWQDPMVKEMVSESQAPGRITVIEWADRLGEHIPSKAWQLKFSHGKSESERVIDIAQISETL